MSFQTQIPIKRQCLGTILYELLVGSTPLDQATLANLDLFQVLDLIRDRTPERPSQRMKDKQPAASITESCQPSTLGIDQRMLIGDLDWVVMKCLEKEPERRYDTVHQFKSDLHRFLNHEPVVARPPTWRYRTSKLIRRYRWQAISALLIVVTMIAGIAGTTTGMILARNRADRESAAKELAELRTNETRKSYGILADVFADLDVYRRNQTGKPIESLLAGRLITASRLIANQSSEDPVEKAKMLQQLANAIENLGYPEDAIGLFEQALDIFRANNPADSEETLVCYLELAGSYLSNRQTENGLNAFQDCLDSCTLPATQHHNFFLRASNGLAGAYIQKGDFSSAMPLLINALEVARTGRLSPDSGFIIRLRRTLAGVYLNVNQPKMACAEFEAALESILDSDEGKNGTHADLGLIQFGLGNCYRTLGRVEDSATMMQKSLKIRTRRLGVAHPDTLHNVNVLANTWCHNDQAKLAEPMLDSTWTAAKERFDTDHPLMIELQLNMALCYERVSRFADAIETIENLLEILQADSNSNHRLQPFSNPGMINHLKRLLKSCRDAALDG